jgi:hypothetical protein
VSVVSQPRIRLQLSERAARYARADAPLEARLMAAGGALPLPPPELATVLFALMHDPEPEVKARAKSSLEGLPDALLAGVLEAEIHPAVLSLLAHVHRDHAGRMERLALNPALDDATLVFLAALPHKRVVEIIANNQQRLLKCPEIVEALGENPLTGRAVIDRILSFLGLERPEGEPEDPDPLPPPPTDLDDVEAAAALRALLGDDHAFARELIEEQERELGEEESRSLYAQLQEMSVLEKIKLARMGNKEARGLLVRDRNKIVATAAIRSPRISETEIVAIAKSRAVCDEVIRVISFNREWTRNYQVKLCLATNPKCPISSATRFLNHLQDRDLRSIMRSKDVPQLIAVQARRILSRKGKV